MAPLTWLTCCLDCQRFFCLMLISNGKEEFWSSVAYEGGCYCCLRWSLVHHLLSSVELSSELMRIVSLLYCVPKCCHFEFFSEITFAEHGCHPSPAYYVILLHMRTAHHSLDEPYASRGWPSNLEVFKAFPSFLF